MSYDLAFWYEVDLITAEEAAEIYDRLADGEVDVVRRSGAVERFVEELTGLYPDLTEDNMHESPWAASLHYNSEGVIASISGSRSREMAAVLSSLARKYGLTTFNPQEGTVH